MNRAAEVLLAAQDLDWGPLQLRGQFEDRATYRAYWMLLKRARAHGMELSPEVHARFFPGESEAHGR